MKTCYVCRDSLPLDCFATDASKRSGRKSICRGCDRAKARRYYLANRERVIARVIARNQGGKS